MSTLIWAPNSTVGVQSLDDQHAILAEQANELRIAVVRGAGLPAISEQLNRMIELTRMHFLSEENLMEQCGYPGLDAHRGEHHQLMAELLEACHRLERGELGATQGVSARLRNWHQEHVEASDMECGRWLNDFGIY